MIWKHMLTMPIVEFISLNEETYSRRATVAQHFHQESQYSGRYVVVKLLTTPLQSDGKQHFLKHHHSRSQISM